MICPSAQRLRQFLNDELSGDAHSAVVAHVGDCVVCQTALDDLTNGETIELGRSSNAAQEYQPAGASPRFDPRASSVDEPDAGSFRLTGDSSLRGLIDRLRDQPLGAWSVATQLASDATSMRFAGPISEAAPLGCLGSYQIEAELGAGTTGQVFVARDARLDRRVAVKVLRPQWATHAEARSRFEREARAVAALADERIVQVFEVGTTDDGVPFMVMEFVRGESLADRLERERSLAPREAALIARGVALGLAAAHRRGIVHRDVKPSNVLLAGVANDGTVTIKLADFGLARVLESTEQLTQEGFIAGTPAYMSPEQIRRPQEADARSDVYSVGVLLYEMLTGERPFRGVVRMVLSQALHDEPIPPRQLNDRIPRDLETVCLKAMSKEPDQRYATASELSDDLQRWLDGRPVLARPIGSVGRTWRWCRRNPKLAMLNLVVIAVLLAGAIDLARYARPSEHWKQETLAARHEAEQSRHQAEQQRLELLRLAQALVLEPTDAIRREPLEAALQSLSAIPKEQHDAEWTQLLATVHRRLAESLAQSNDLGNSLEHNRQAISLLRQLIAEHPSRHEWRLELVRSLIRAGETSQSLAQATDADRFVADGLRELDSLTNESLDSEAGGAVGQTRVRVAESLTRMNRSDEARRQLRLGCETLGRIASQPESKSAQQRDALAAVGRLANDLLERDQLADAFAVLDPAAAWAERLLNSDDLTFADQQEAVLLLRNLTLVALRLDRRADATRRCEELEQRLAQLEADPRVTPRNDWADWIAGQRRAVEDLKQALSQP